jgi:hypothetical protein
MGFTKLTLAELELLSKEKLEDARILFSDRRFTACYYLCGYAIELILKFRIAKQLNWLAVDFKVDSFLKIHDLDKLIKYTGVWDKVLKMPAWDTCRKWTVEYRYQDAKSISEQEATQMLNYSQELVSWLLVN